MDAAVALACGVRANRPSATCPMATRGTVPRRGILRLVLAPRRPPEPRLPGSIYPRLTCFFLEPGGFHVCSQSDGEVAWLARPAQGGGRAEAGSPAAGAGSARGAFPAVR